MSGKLFVLAILTCAVVAGAALYYLQVYGFYRSVEDPGSVTVIGPEGPVDVAYSGFEAIDADSSPLRYRACFDTSVAPQSLPDPLEKAVPRNGPRWFDCFDAPAIAGALEAGEARAFVVTKNIHYGVDRIVAITALGRGYIWHDLNDCGEKAYDGTVVGEECPPRPEEAE